MPSPINITTLSGVRLDVNPSATIELNMGGMSLLSLSDRTATYTNSFSLPRTPINEREFAFISQPTRNNKAVIDVYVTKGLLQKRAKLTVSEFNKEYKCTLSYDYENVIKKLSELNFYTLPEDGLITTIKETAPAPSADEVLLHISTLRNDGGLFSPFVYRSTVGNGAISVLSFLQRITDLTGITFSGDALSNTDLLKTLIFNKYVLFEYRSTLPSIYGYNVIQKMPVDVEFDFISCADVLKALSQILLFDIKFNGMGCELKSLENAVKNTAINVEGFEFTKRIYSGYMFKNDITYKTDPTIDSYLGSDSFVGDGVGVKKAIEIKSFIPKTYENTYSPFVRGGYDPKDADALKEIIIFAIENISATADFRMTWPEHSLTSSDSLVAYTALPLTIYPAYSNILTPIFTNPIILDATKWFDHFTANQIMESRVINSVQLGGRYWVDSMAYNITTGQSKMTLIKL